MNKIKRPIYEVTVVLIVVILTVVLGLGLYAGRARMQKCKLLMNELSMLRSAVMTYKMINKRNPDSLGDLVATTYKADSVEKPYLDTLPGLVEGRVVDPFGAPYAYDPESGWLQSSSPDYRSW